MIKNKPLLIRKIHRYLGLFIGIQFLGWTISGLYFSWNYLGDVHGNHMRKDPHMISASWNFVSPDSAMRELKAGQKIDSIQTIQLISVVGKPLYQIVYYAGHADGTHHKTHYALADASTGRLRGPLTKEESIAIARDHVVASAEITNTEIINNTDSHHEYRGRPLPAYVVTFKNPDCTVYISPERGNFQTIRHDQWRAFDFLWMFHTMDYAGRDNFNNWLLKTLSILGFLTVLSGFVLFVISSRTLRKLTT